ncbi:MAG: hypothetical protein HZB14_04685 [Actinobacteria bacterium]|nr:hypothetical protein [Actinomycetota bacterium]
MDGNYDRATAVDTVPAEHRTRSQLRHITQQVAAQILDEVVASHTRTVPAEAGAGNLGLSHGPIV